MCGLASPGAAATIGGMSHANLSPTPSRRLHRTAPRRLQRGFSLLEALVSIVVLSFGLLGVAGLQASSLKYSRDARNQAVAVNLAREMAEMIRSNARVSGETNNAYLIGNQIDLSSAKAPSGAQATGPFADGDALAKAQVADWQYRVGQALPGAYASVCLDDAPYDADGYAQWGCTRKGDIIAIKIGWEREDTSGEIKAANAAGVRPFVVLPVTPAGQQ